MNEDSIWSGTFQDRLNPRAHGAFLRAREFLMKENMTAAGEVVINDMVSHPPKQRSYQPMAELFADFGHHKADVSNYTRWLDTWDGDVGSEYVHKGVRYRRTAFGSYPASVMVFRFEADKSDSLNVTISLFRERHVVSHNSEIGKQVNKIKVVAKTAAKEAMEFTAEARISVSGSNAISSSNGTAVIIQNADSITVYVDAETSYRYATRAGREEEVQRKLDSVSKSPFQDVLQTALTDYQNLSRRVSLDLGSSGTLVYSQPLTAYTGKETGIASLPANLQGVWSPSYNPPWGGKYTININTEMNYWPAEITNLAETHPPLFDLIEVARPRGRDIARRMYNCPGFVVHHNTELWGDAAPVDNGTQYTMWPMGGAWLPLRMMEHYRFNGNKTFLSQEALPVLLEAADFFYCYMFEFQGYYVTGPSISPENRFRLLPDQHDINKTEAVDIAPSMDNQILWELLSAIVEAANELGIPKSDSMVQKALLYRSKLRPPQVGEDGILLEWRREYPEAAAGHRHVSHLFGLYPGRWINMQDTPEYAAATRKSLTRRLSRGGGHTGWSRAWTINWFARLWQGDSAWENVETFLNISTNDNMFSNNPYPVFQCDGNFGFTAGIAEMLLQSHTSTLHLLPALPSSKHAIATGSVRGLVARGGFVIDIAWINGQFTNATILSRLGNVLNVRIANGTAFKINGMFLTNNLTTKLGETYLVTPM